MNRRTRAYALAKKPYMEIISTCIDELAEHGCFSKSEVLQKTEYDVLKPRWDWIQWAIEQDIGGKIIPVAQAYFQMSQKERELEPEKALPIGNGKTTAGYVLPDKKHEALLRRRVLQQRLVVRGMVKTNTARLDHARKHGVLPHIREGDSPLLKIYTQTLEQQNLDLA